MVEPLAAPLAAWLLQLGRIPSVAMFAIGWLRAPQLSPFWWEPKNSHKTQESPPWQASAASSGADSTVIADPMQTERGRGVGGGVG
jgi:hypothetical protein